MVSQLLVEPPTTFTAREVTRSLPRRSLSVRQLARGLENQILTAPDDAAEATRRVRGDFPGQDKEAKKAGEEGYEAVRATAQDYVRHLLILASCQLHVY